MSSKLTALSTIGSINATDNYYTVASATSFKATISQLSAYLASLTQTLSNKTFGDAIVLTEIATPATPSAGWSRFYQKSGGRLAMLDSRGREGILPRVLCTKIDDTGFPSSTAENSLIGTIVGSNVIPANGFVQGKAYYLMLAGYTRNAAGGSFTMRIKLGSVTCATLTRSDTTANNRGWTMNFLLTCRTTGVSGTVFTSIVGDGSYGSSVAMGGDYVATSATTINTTISNTVDVTYQNATSDVNNYGYLSSMVLQEIN